MYVRRVIEIGNQGITRTLYTSCARSREVRRTFFCTTHFLFENRSLMVFRRFSDGLKKVSDGFQKVSDGFKEVSDAFRWFQAVLDSFQTVFRRFQTVSDGFQTVFRRFQTKKRHIWIRKQGTFSRIRKVRNYGFE